MAEGRESIRFAGIWNVYAHVLLFGLIFLEWSFSALVAWKIPGLVTVAAIMCLFSPLLLFAKIVELDKGNLILFLLIMAMTLFSCLRDGDLSNNLLLLAAVLAGYLVSVFFSPEEFARVFGNVVQLLAAVSLPVFTLSVLAPNLIDRLPLLASSYMDQAGAQVHNAFFAVGITHSMASRNCGITWEPGAFSILICVALYLALLFPRKGNTSRIILLVITELTTLSTMGIAVMCAILLLMHSGDKSVKKSVVVAVVVMALLAASAFGLMDYILNALFSKLEGLVSGSQALSVTTQDRLNAVIYPLSAFADAPVFGVGYTEFLEININQCNGVATNTFANWFALMGCIYGMPCALFYFRAVYKGLKRLHANWIVALTVIGASILMLSTEDLIRISLVYVIVFYGSSGLSGRSVFTVNQIEENGVPKEVSSAS